jgi:CspA family cold shock protein
MSNTIHHTGKVKFYNVTKGYGFIKSDIDGVEYFVHATGLINQIKQEQNVSFFLEASKKEGKGMNAINVRIN